MAKRNFGLAVMSTTVGITINELDSPGNQSVKKALLVRFVAPNMLQPTIL